MDIMIYTFTFFLLLVTPNMPPVSVNNDAVKRLSFVWYFPLKKLYTGRS